MAEYAGNEDKGHRPSFTAPARLTPVQGAVAQADE